MLPVRQELANDHLMPHSPGTRLAAKWNKKGLKIFACGAVWGRHLCMWSRKRGRYAPSPHSLLTPHSLMRISRSCQVLPDGFIVHVFSPWFTVEVRAPATRLNQPRCTIRLAPRGQLNDQPTHATTQITRRAKRVIPLRSPN